MTIKKIITITAVAVISVLMVYGFILISRIFSSNTKFEEKELYVYVPTGANYTDVKKILEPYIKNFENFEMVADKRSYPENVKSGRFLLKKDMNN
ncbi:MAG: aminodeoxychorismate lyase, partial [Flavobacterium sp.]